MTNDLWIDGFELDRTLASLSLQYNNPGGGWPANVASTPGRFGGLSIPISTCLDLTLTTSALPWTLPSNAREVFFGVAVRCLSPGTHSQLFGMVGGVISFQAWKVGCSDNGDGTYVLQLLDADDVVLGSTANLTYGEWNYVEVNVLSQVAGTYEWRLNGEPLGSGTSNFLPNGVPQSKVQFRFPDTPGSIEYDDHYATEIGFKGPDFVVEALQPNGDGSVTDWTPKIGGDSYLQVDDPGDSDGDDTYVEVTLDGSTDLYTFPTLTFLTGVIESVRFQLDGRNTDGTNRKVTPEFIIDGVDGQGAEQTVIDEEYQRIAEVLLTRPSDDESWERGDFVGIEVGMTKGTPIGQTVLALTDEEGTVGYILVDGANNMIPLLDEDGVAGELPTHDTNTKLALFDEDQIEGDFPLTVI